MKKRRTFDNVKKGWYEIGGNKYYFRSMLEYRYASLLEALKVSGKIKNWLYESETFWFLEIKRGVRSYKPDFQVIENDGSRFFVECKGYLDAKSITKIKRFRKYYPNEKLVLYPHSLELKILKKEKKCCRKK